VLSVVSTLADSGSGSLRQAIIDADNDKGSDLVDITFRIGSETQTITPVSALPVITHPVAIDGSAPADFPDQVIVINGARVGEENGLDIHNTNGCLISDLVINGFGPTGREDSGVNGLVFVGCSGCLVVGCKIGTDAAGQTAVPNNAGVALIDSPDNTIGGITPGQGNLISGNGTWGLAISGAASQGNFVEGNLIGTDASGTKSLGNLVGILVSTPVGRTDFASANTIGGTFSGAGNTISGNGDDGIELFRSGQNLIAGNLIGTTADGTGLLGNGRAGIMAFSALGNTIGGTTPGDLNVISGNGGGSPIGSGIDPELAGGLTLEGDSTTNLVQGNLIGTDAGGTQSVPNSPNGVLITSLAGDATGPSDNTIGGTTDAARNVISGNNGDGVRIEAGSSNLVAGDWIGLASSSQETPLGNGVKAGGGNGVTIVNAIGNTIGGMTAITGEAPGNVISGNAGDGVLLDAGAVDNQVLGNVIGLDSSGTLRQDPGSGLDYGNNGNGVHLTNAANNTIGGNVISANASDGVYIHLADASGNHVIGNRIGTDGGGDTGLGNGNNGVEIDGAPNNVIGDFGLRTTGSNLISGNQNNGVLVTGVGAAHNLVQSNLIGTDKNGTALPSVAGALSNAQYGIFVSGAPNNTIGGPNGGNGNVVSNNHTGGIEISGADANHSVVEANLVGTDLDSTVGVPNGAGIELKDTSNNTIGGALPGSGNTIGGNDASGLKVTGGQGQVIQGNMIGVTAFGTPLVNFGDGIDLFGATQNTIGSGTLDAAGHLLGANVIGNNTGNGIALYDHSDQNHIVGNFIGTDQGRIDQLGNGAGGIYLDASQNTIGGTASGAGNVIEFNGRKRPQHGFGVTVASGTQDQIRHNAIAFNAGRGIDLGDDPKYHPNDLGDGDAGPNTGQNFPYVTSVIQAGGLKIVYWRLNSTPSSAFDIDLFSNTALTESGYGDGETFQYTLHVTTDVNGMSDFTSIFPPSAQLIAATATDASGNTSEFSLVDSDADGLADSWELSGIDVDGDGTIDITLPGADPMHKDVYVEVDAMQAQGAMQSQVPIKLNGGGPILPPGLATDTSLDFVIESFLHAPQALVNNPDGKDGVTLHIQPDEWNIPAQAWDTDLNGNGVSPYGEDLNANGKLDPGEDVNGNGILDDGDAADQYGFPFFYKLKAGTPGQPGGFGTADERTHPTTLLAKSLAYRYCVFAYDFVSSNGTGQGVDLTTSGISEYNSFTVGTGASQRLVQVGGNDFMVTLGKWGNPAGVPYSRIEWQAGTFMHELGHTLGLGHGGGDDIQFKPNYYSVMNYIWQMPKPWMYESVYGKDFNGDGDTNDLTWKLDYSTSTLPTIDENNVDESKPLGGDPTTWLNWPLGAVPPTPSPQNGRFDWNQDGTTSSPVQAVDLNGDSSLDVFAGHEDWSHLQYDFQETPTFFGAAKGDSDGGDLTFDQEQELENGPPPSTDPGTLQLSGATYDVREDAGSVTITVIRSGGTAGPVSIHYATSAGTATPGSDYQDVSGDLSFIDGQLSASFTVPILNDALAEDPEAFTVTLSNPAGGAALGAQSTATVTIDDDKQPVPATYVVTNAYDDGPGSLHQAILDSNAHLGADTIVFDVTGGTILVPLSPLPPITDPVTIDATTQPGYAGAPLFQVTGVLAGDGAVGLDVQAGHTTVKALVIDGFTIGLRLGGGTNAAIGNWVGPDLTGVVGLANRGTGIWIPSGSTGNVIGGATAADLNVISDNRGAGILVDGSDNSAQGNWIGLDPTGLAALGNGTGVMITGAGNTVGAGNVISGNLGAGVDISGPGSTGNVIQGNAIGPDVPGAGRISNQGDGILAENQAAGNTIGGTDPGAGNLIAGNVNAQVHLVTGATSTRILGNTIDAFLNPDQDIETGPGVLVEGSSNNVLGGVDPGAGNRITSDSHSVVIFSGTGNAVRGNAIVAVAQNSSYMGIDLGGDGPTPNDSQDRDTGANNFQNFPTISSAALTGGSVAIKGSLNSTPRTTFLIDLYTSVGIQRFGTVAFARSGEVYLAAVSVTTDANGNASFSTTVPTSALVGYNLTATATDPAGNTSEFSDSFELDVDGDGVIDAFEAAGLNSGDGNSDGVPDRFQPNVASLPGQITFAGPAGSQFRNVQSASNPSPGDVPGRATFWGGLFSWTLTSLTPGSAADVQVVVADTIPFNAYYRYGPTVDQHTRHWDTLAFDAATGTGTEITGPHTLTLHLVDGGRGDDDLFPNGTIGDLGGPVDGPETFVVTNTADDGPGSLHQAILDSNHHFPIDTIAFAIDTGPQVIAPLHVLPAITNGVIIDGTTQPGYAGTPLIALSGANNQDYVNVTSSANLPAFIGLEVDFGPTTIRGLDINSFSTRTFPIGNTGLIGTVFGTGILIKGGRGNVVAGNYIGSDLSGTIAAPNSIGIDVRGSSNNRIGGTTPADRNVISGNERNAVFIDASTSSSQPPSVGNVVEGNYIGTKSDGVSRLGNGFAFAGKDDLVSAGILVNQPPTQNTTIGGTAPGAGNTIAFSGGPGVLTNLAINTSILGNSMFDNGGFGIMDDFGANPFVGDADYRIGGTLIFFANAFHERPNYPILSSATFDTAGNTVIQGRLNNQPNETYRIEFFSNADIDASSFGEGRTYLGATFVTTDATGNATFTATLPTLDATDRFVTATATTPTGITSKFSARIAIGDTLGSVFVVNTADDHDDGVADATDTSLREAILAANNHPGPDVIEFAIPGTGPQTIKPTFDLPAIINPVTIDATTQPGYAVQPLVELRGTLRILPPSQGGIIPGPADTGLRLLVGDTTIRGLVLNGFDTAISAVGPAGGNVIQACYIGTDVTGTQPTVSGAGINLGYQTGDLIGGPDPGEGNLLSSNLFGALVTGSGSGNTIQGNLIGTDATGTRALGNTQIIAGGVSVSVGDTGDLIGGTTAGARNVFAAGTGPGLFISGDNLVQGNFFGTDITGTKALGNGWGIQVGGGATTIGGSASGAGNLISGNLDQGLLLEGGVGDGSVIQGNLIGTDVTGTQPLPNFIGVGALDAFDYTLGGTASGAGNTIAFNTAQGVEVVRGHNLAILGNSVFGNGALGIDLGGDGVTPNDLGDLDDGPNSLQNFPVLTQAIPGATTHVAATLNSLPNTTYTLSFYASAAADPSGFGQGQRYLGSATVTTDDSGNASVALDLPAPTSAGEVLSATATDPSGNTSEFSRAAMLQAPSLVRVASVVVNHGAVQRSMVTSLTITFSGVVTLSPGAVTVLLQGSWKSVGLVLKTSVVNQQTVLEVTFTGSGVVAGSVGDGRYNLLIAGNLVHDASGQALDGAGSGRAGSSYVANNAFSRLFGDANGDGVVDDQDRALFLGSLGTKRADTGYLAYFDYDGNGVIDSNDQAQFMKRYGKRI
jgi:CSLREA domain-containing protein